MPEPSPEAWALIRHAYEHTSRPIVDICAEHGITGPMLRYRVKRWGWQKRRSLIPLHGPPATPPPVMAETTADLRPATSNDDARSTSEAPCEPASGEPDDFANEPIGDSTAIVPRLQSAVTRLLPAIESVIGQLAGGPHSAHAMAQAARALGALTRTLRELNTLLAQREAAGEQGRCPHCVDLPEDMDAYRIELARRIDAFIASRQVDPG